MTGLLRRAILVAIAAAFFVAGLPAGPSDAWARSSGSSGGYSRPSGGSSSSSSSGASRRPSVSGGSGYSRPPATAPSGSAFAPSASDRAISRSTGGQGLQTYQSQQAPRPPPASSGAPAGGSFWGGTAERRPPVSGPSYSQPSYAQPSYAQPSGAVPLYAAPRRQFGAFEAAFLFSMLNSLSNASSARFFHDNQYDPGYQQWRRQVDTAAQTDPALAAKVAQLEAQLAQQQDLPRKPAALPPPQTQGSGMVWLILLLAVGVLVALWLFRRRAAGAAAAAAPPGLKGSAQSRFRVGMTLPIDPTPFVLAAAATKVIPPQEGAMLSVEAVGLVQDGAVSLHRLYLPGSQSFFQLHLGADGTPDECRYFSAIDEVTPASPDDWAFWLDPAQGMIGWPQFQTKDGRLYDRVWAPGGVRVAPRAQTETIETLSGQSTRQLQAMLYAAASGAAPPAPPTEYVLVTAIQIQGQAWVQIHAGIDINPASLNLPMERP